MGVSIRHRQMLRGVFAGAVLILSLDVTSQEIDAVSHRSIVEALQTDRAKRPTIFPLEALSGGVQSVTEGLRYPYFGYGERRYLHRTDFHPAIDVAYEPLETGVVETVYSEKVTVRSPQSYSKGIYAIQDGVLHDVALKGSGYKVTLRHVLQQPYYDSDGVAYSEYYTCYRHVDARTLIYLSLLARKITNNNDATYEDLIGTHSFAAGEKIAFVGFDPNLKKHSRSHLDFSLNLFADPDKGMNIRKYALNPLLLFAPLDYANPDELDATAKGKSVYRFVIDPDSIIRPSKRKNGEFQIQITSSAVDTIGRVTPLRYFALNAMHITVHNGGETIGTFTVDRHRKLGYDVASYEGLDEEDPRIPHFAAPLNEQGDVFRMGAVLPARWFRELQYDWSKPGRVSVTVASIWQGYLDGHSHSFEIPLGAGQ